MKLEKYLRDMCINRNQFCKRIGVSYPTISNIIKGIGDPHVSIAIRIEDATEGKVTCRDIVNPLSMMALERKSKHLMMLKK